MNGVFIKSRFSIALNILGLVSGIALIATLPFFVVADGPITSDTIFRLPFLAFLGLVLIIFCIASLLFNKGAYLHLNEDRISSHFLWKTKLDCRYSDVAFCEYGMNTLNIRLTNGKRYIIPGLMNSADICGEIRKKMTIPTNQENVPLFVLTDEIQILKKQRTKWLAWVIVFGSLMFIIIGLTVFFTDGKEFSEFVPKDWITFVCFGVLEFIVVVSTFFFANKCGKLKPVLSEKTIFLKRRILQTAPLPSGNVVKTFIDTDYTARVIVFGYPNQEDVSYIVQVVDENFKVLTTYTSEIFQNSQDLSLGL